MAVEQERALCRRHNLAETINKFRDDLIAEQRAPEYSIEDYIRAGERESVEFKGSLRWD